MYANAYNGNWHSQGKVSWLIVNIYILMANGLIAWLISCCVIYDDASIASDLHSQNNGARYCILWFRFSDREFFGFLQSIVWPQWLLQIRDGMVTLKCLIVENFTNQRRDRPQQWLQFSQFEITQHFRALLTCYRTIVLLEDNRERQLLFTLLLRIYMIADLSALVDLCKCVLVMLMRVCERACLFVCQL